LIPVSFFDPVQDRIAQVETRLRDQADEQHPNLGAALKHLLSSGGKRIRVAVTLLMGGMLHADPQRLVTLAAAIEALHTATLVHDDLIDGALIRRGIPTLNAQWSPAATVLTGDFIFAQAAKLAAETETVEVMKLFAQTLATIVNGEITQLFGGRGSASREQYNQRIYAKTASLFEAAARSAALLSRVDESIVDQVEVYGYEIGMAFQIMDDILDFTGEQTAMGKPVASDLRQGLITLPALFYLEAHPQDQDMLSILNSDWCDDHCMERLLGAIRESGAIDRAHEEARGYIQRGVDALATLPEGVERRALEELALFIVQRRN
jgi:geranylgeranyl pyrophosphate synthase